MNFYEIMYFRLFCILNHQSRTRLIHNTSDRFILHFIFAYIGMKMNVLLYNEQSEIKTRFLKEIKKRIMKSLTQ